MSVKVFVGEGDELRLPGEQRRRWGLSSGAEFELEETPQGLLLRRADPMLTRIYVEPTSGCNLSCRTCVRNSWAEPIGTMSMEVYRRLIKGLRRVPSLRKMSFWGFGEPLLHPNILEMVALAKGLGAETQLITNGLLLDREMAGGLVEAGLDSLVVSVDGASAEAYADVRSGARLGIVRQNVEGLRAARRASPRHNPEIGLEFVVMRRNAGELKNLHSLAHSMGASFIVLTNVLPYTEDLNEEILYGNIASISFPVPRSKWWPEVFLPRIDSQRQVLEPLLELLQHTSAVDPPLGRFGGTGPYCRFVNEGSAVVAWDGEVSPCIALMHSYPCYVMRRRKEIRRYTLGNVGKEKITDIWAREEFANFRRLVRKFDFSPCADCGGCDLAETNEEDCFGNSFPVCGDCLWARGVIQCP